MGDAFYVSRQSIASVQGAARRLRRQATAAEEALWNLLRGGRLRGLRFRRQHPIGAFILDFYCPAARLAVELDGPIHDEPSNRTHDHQRTLALQTLGITVLRFTNDRVTHTPQTVLTAIAQSTTRMTTHTFPQPTIPAFPPPACASAPTNEPLAHNVGEGQARQRRAGVRASPPSKGAPP